MGSFKLFIGGISWETNEDGLREYFGNFGEVLEVLIMKDKITGRSRGFGFVVFADHIVAERVVKQKHMIDGRNVEAKKAVPREDQLSVNRSSDSNQSSPSPARTRKIFVGGLPSAITESEFKKYFEQYGTITDVVVMYDLNTKRPRGFGFITYDSEETVDRVLMKTFHELNGKMVEVKRAVPKDLSPSPNRSLVSNYGLNKVSNFVDAYSSLGYNQSALGGYGMRMDGRFSPLSIGRNGYLQYSSINYPMGPNLDSILSSDYIGNGNYQPNIGYGRGLSPIQSVYSNRHNTPAGYDTRMGVNGSLLNAAGRNMWPNGNLHYDTIKPSHINDFGGPQDGNTEFPGALASIGSILGYSNSGQDGGRTGSYNRTVNYGPREDKFMAYEAIAKNNGSSTVRGSSSYFLNDNNDEPFGNLWQSFSSETVNSGGINYRHGIGNTPLDVNSSNSSGYMGGASGSYRGIAA